MNLPHLKDRKAFSVAMETALPRDRTSIKQFCILTPCTDSIGLQLFTNICYQNIQITKKGKGFPYSLLNVGPGADPGVQAVSL